MGRLIWSEIKILLRKPSLWLPLGAISVLFFYFIVETPHFFIEPAQAFTGMGRRPIASLVEWGRSALLMIGTNGSGLFAPFVAFLAVGAFFPELIHREVAWATPKAGWARLVWARLLAVSMFTTLLICLSAGAAFFNPVNSDILVLAGARYVPVYLALTWIQILLWVTLSQLFLYFTRSRWVTLALVTLVQATWLLIGVLSLIPGPFLRLIQRSLLSWNFMGPLAPLGVIPTVYIMHILAKIGVIVCLIGAAICVRKSFPEWAGIKIPSAKAVVVVGIVLAVVAGSGTIWEFHRRTAPFTVRELWQGTDARFDQPYIWSSDGRLLHYPGEFTAVRLPEGVPLPAWVEELAEGKELHRYNVGNMLVSPVSGGRGVVTLRQSLVLIHPPQRPYPAELANAVKRFRHEIQPMLERSQVWIQETDIIIAWPEEAFWRPIITPTPEGMVAPIFMLTGWHKSNVAWPLVVASGIEGPARTYLGLYLMEAIDPEWIEMDLDWLRAIADGRKPDDWLRAIADGRKPDVTGHRRRHWPLTRTWWHPEWAAEEATLILHHWQQGEQLGHANYIRTLLEGDN